MPLLDISKRPQALPNLDLPTHDSNPNVIALDPSIADLPTHPERDSRPTSPHNVSSPKWSSQPHNFLSVPTGRGRGDSVDSDENAPSPTSYGGDTFIPSPSSSQNGENSRSDTANSREPLLSHEEALRPDPGTEADFDVVDNSFAFSPGQLSKLLNPKSLAAFHALGGLRGLEVGLRTDRSSGLSVDEKRLAGLVSFDDAIKTRNEVPEVRTITRSPTVATKSDDSYLDRRRVFKENVLPARKIKSIFELLWLSYNDKMLMLLTVAAIVSLGLGIYQSITATDGEARVQWVEGVAIMVAIIIVVVVGALNDWQKEKQFLKLNKKKEERNVQVVRSGKSRQISVYDVLVGDVMHLEPGDLIPVDGVFISGHNVRCDESSATGESDLLKKTPADDVYRAIESNDDLTKLDPFIISGAKVTEGIGTFLVTAIGVNSTYGKTMMSLQEDSQVTPLQSKLNVMATHIAKLGLASGLLLFLVTFIEFLVRLSLLPDSSSKGQAFLNVLIVAVTIIVVAVPEGLPLAVTLALAYATTRMLKDNNLVRQLRACETMGNATSICSDKTGTLTQNKMTVVSGTIGLSVRFGEKTTPDDLSSSAISKSTNLSDMYTDSSIREAVSSLCDDVRDVLKASIVINSTAFEGEMDGKEDFIGSKTETALLNYAKDYLDMGPLGEERSAFNVVQLVPFDSTRKCMATVIKTFSTYRLFVKGASEYMLEKCNRIVKEPTKTLSPQSISLDDMNILTNVIDNYANRSLRTIGLLYKDFDHWPPTGSSTDDPKQANFDKIFKDMIFLGIVGIQDPLRVGVSDAVQACQRAGSFVRMVTGDNLLTAKAIGAQCGIFTSDGLAMEGPAFRSLSRHERRQVVSKLQVLARSSPRDKKLLVETLKEMGETVAVTGDGTNDAPALKSADVGFSMGIAGTEVAKEASDIILMDDNFASIVKAIMWGRSVNDAVKKFLQFQVTVNITAVLLTFITAVSSTTETSVLSAVQLLWVNLIMDTFAALALATDPPTESILDRPPELKSSPLVTVNMWKMIFGQSTYQLAVTLVLFFAGDTILNYRSSFDQSQLQTVIFNAFVFMQIFNQFNCRRLDNKLNIFEGIHRNYFFMGIQIIILGGQLLIIFFGSNAFSVAPLTGIQWAITVVIGLLSIPIGILLRFVPDSAVAKLLPSILHKTPPPEVVISDEERQFEWHPALEDIKDQLAFLKLVRGGRLNLLRYKLSHPRQLLTRSRSGSRSRANSIPHSPHDESPGSASPGPPTPDSRLSISRLRGRSRSNSAFGPAAAMAGIVAGSIGGWSPVDRSALNPDGSFRFQPDRRDLDRLGSPDNVVDPLNRRSNSLVPPPTNGGLSPASAILPRPASAYGLGLSSSSGV